MSSRRTERAWRIRAALEALREARELLAAAGAPRALARVRRALTSAEGALRHVERPRRAEELEEEQREIPIPDVLEAARAELERRGDTAGLEGLGRCEARLVLGLEAAADLLPAPELEARPQAPRPRCGFGP